MGSSYTAEFYDLQGSGASASARRIVPLVRDLAQPQSVIDLGCGRGHWLSAFKQAGISAVHGIDGPWVDAAANVLEAREFTRHDFTATADRPRLPREKYDVALSLEVLEHLNDEAAARAVSLLCDLSDILVVGVAIPAQGGTDHVNEQWPSYWHREFQANGFECFDCIRPQVWNDAQVEWWYAQNTLVYARGAAAETVRSYTLAVQGRIGEPLALVHPSLYALKVRLLHHAWEQLSPPGPS